jgi:hypothetical protein
MSIYGDVDTGDVESLMKKQVLQRNAFENQSIFLKDVNDLMHVSQKQILMVMTFDM